MPHDEQDRDAGAYDAHLIRWIWQFVKPYQRLFWISALLMPLNSVFALAQPYIVKVTIDTLLDHRKLAPPHWLARIFGLVGAGHGFLVMGAIYLTLILGEFATYFGQFYLTMMVAQYSLSDLRLALFRHVEKLPPAYFDRTPIGRLVSRISTDIDAISEMFSSGSLTIFIDFLTLTGIAVIMFMLNPRLAMYAFLSIPPLIVIINFFRVRARVVYREIRDRLAAVNAYLSESINGMAVIQLFTRENVSRDEFDVLNRKSRDVQMLANIYEAGLFSAVESLSAITVAMILWFGGGDVIHRAISIGTLVAFIDYAQRFFGPLREISNKYTTLQSALAAVDKIERVMLEPVTIASPAKARRPTAAAGSVVFEHVNFEYRKGEPVLKDLSFSVTPGQKIAIVGPTGSGKTTIMKLLNRFYDVTSGRILVDGVDVREWDLTALRRTIGLVQQDVFLFAGDIAENVRLGRIDLSEAELRQALGRAQALRFVERLPDGLAQQVSERGANLSSGQRQLLSFARALAYDPKILVMDEATSSVDSETERLIQIALNELLADRTALIIAHRLSTIERADRIMVLAGGMLRESGTHEELLKLRGLYYRLFELQYATAVEPARAAVD
ncbi:MAG TPA: ABC transporter ATP-binding protein [Candidatus Binataceae bacterium]|nr:ABC transporter ATP-binding protein [Candidatus Binataceae bacterium]